MLQTYGATPLPVADIVAMVGEGARELVARALAQAGVVTDVDEALVRFLAAYDERLTVATVPYPRALDTLARLHGVARLSILTNKPQRQTDGVLPPLGLDRFFASAIGGDTTLGRKPDPTGLRTLIEESGIPAAETLMIGDSWVDVATARAAGVDACLVSFGFGYPLADEASRAEARYTIASLDELLALAEIEPDPVRD